jgi:lysozyme
MLVTVPLHQCQFDSLTSWCFNLGPTNLNESTMLKVLNQGNYEEVPYQLKRWNKVNGQVNDGLIRRREAEALLFEGKDWSQV